MPWFQFSGIGAVFQYIYHHQHKWAEIEEKNGEDKRRISISQCIDRKSEPFRSLPVMRNRQTKLYKKSQVRENKLSKLEVKTWKPNNLVLTVQTKTKSENCTQHCRESCQRQTTCSNTHNIQIYNHNHTIQIYNHTTQIYNHNRPLPSAHNCTPHCHPVLVVCHPSCQSMNGSVYPEFIHSSLSQDNIKVKNVCQAPLDRQLIDNETLTNKDRRNRLTRHISIDDQPVTHTYSQENCEDSSTLSTTSSEVIINCFDWSFLLRIFLV